MDDVHSSIDVKGGICRKSSRVPTKIFRRTVNDDARKTVLLEKVRASNDAEQTNKHRNSEADLDYLT